MADDKKNQDGAGKKITDVAKAVFQAPGKALDKTLGAGKNIVTSGNGNALKECTAARWPSKAEGEENKRREKILTDAARGEAVDFLKETGSFDNASVPELEVLTQYGKQVRNNVLNKTYYQNAKNFNPEPSLNTSNIKSNEGYSAK